MSLRSVRARLGVVLGLACYLSPVSGWAAHLPAPAVTLVSGDSPPQQFGRAAAAAGDFNHDGYADVIAGAPTDTTGGRMWVPGDGPHSAGRAYLFFGGPLADAVPDRVFTGTPGQELGSVVGSIGDFNGDGVDDVFISGPGPGGKVVNVYYGGATPDNLPDLVVTSALSGFGWSAGGAGDVNDDGFDDLIVGAAGANRAELYLGGYSPSATAALTLSVLVQPTDNFGAAVSSAGDVNGDAYDDVLVGAPGFNGTLGSQGRAYLFLGGASMDAAPDLQITGTRSAGQAGTTVGAAGDVNGDGSADFLVGTHEKRAYLFYGGPGLDATVDLFLKDPSFAGGFFGWNTLGTAGDVNGDGFDDVVVPDVTTAHAYLYYGTGAGLHSTPDWTLEGEFGTEEFGWVAGTAGDWNGDGRSEVLVGAPYAGATDVGAVYLYDLTLFATSVPNPRSRELSFAPPRPNPAVESVGLALEIESEAVLTIDLLDLAGRRVATPVRAERVSPGRFERSWRPEALPAGRYFLRARSGARESVRSLVWAGGK